MNFIYNETLTWVVDWINKTFTTQYVIEKIEEVYVGWAPYRGITYTGQTVVLNDAPPAWSWQPTIDYFESTTPPPVTESDVSLGLIINDVYDKLSQDRVSGGIPNDVYKESQIKLAITSGWRRIENSRALKDVISSYSFRKAKEFTLKQKDSSSIDIGEQSYIPSTGKLSLDNWAIFDYNGYSWWIISSIWVIGDTGATLSFWYKLPSSVLKVSEVRVGWTLIEPDDIREWTNRKNTYCVADWYLFLPITNKEDVVVVKYVKTHNIIEEDTDLFPLEWDYFEMLSYYALYKICALVEDDRTSLFYQEYETIKKQYKAYKSRQVDWIKNTLKSGVLKQY